MFKTSNSLLKPFRRLLHEDSRFQVSKRDKLVKFIGKDAKEILKKRLDSQAPAKTRNENPNKTFQPFPFKVTQDNKLESIKRCVMPLSDVTYEEQLSSKQTYCRKGLRLLTQQLYNAGTPIRQDVNRLPCIVKPTVASPHIDAYRSKDEFSIWRGWDGETETVGFMVFPIGLHGDTVCVEPEGLSIMRPESIEMSKLLQSFIRTKKVLPVCYSLSEGGWRRFIVKTNSEGELMVIGCLNPRMFLIKDIMNEKQIFKDFMSSEADKAGLKLRSIYFQACPDARCTHEKAPFELIHGQPILDQTFAHLKIYHSPETTLHENLAGFQLLCENVKLTMRQSFNLDEMSKPIIIDARCGPGLLCMYLADQAREVVGVDPLPSNIKDASNFSELNGLQNCRFVTSDIEIVIEQLLAKYAKEGREIIMIGYSNKRGFKPHVIQSIRNCKSIKKMIYISPQIENDNNQSNLVRLCQNYSGPGRGSQPFIPVLATPVDLKPQCDGSDVIIALQRLVD